MSNQIIRKKHQLNLIVRKDKVNVPQEEEVDEKIRDNEVTDEEEIITNGKKPIIKLIQKTVTKVSDVDKNGDIPEMPQINTRDLLSQYSDITRTKIDDVNPSKEEMIERVEDQRDQLVKNKSKYKEEDYRLKLSTIETLLSKLRRGLIDHNLEEMNDKRVKIDKIVLDKKIPKEQFKSKIDLSGERDNNDPHSAVFSSGQEYFKKFGTYQNVPKELAKIDPSKNKNKNFGNQKMPNDLLRMINFGR